MHHPVPSHPNSACDNVQGRHRRCDRLPASRSPASRPFATGAVTSPRSPMLKEVRASPALGDVLFEHPPPRMQRRDRATNCQ
ncbi:hypothetical protein DENSPDRAFT_838841 [Dentipellis sp. KUC8613]|nr:hypothetical protein DENSPDRAFT_838841 [Dentipellis sp. KUC8613]